MTWTLHLGDCLDPIAGLASLKAGTVDVVITDPVWPNRPDDMWPDVDADRTFGLACDEFSRLAPQQGRRFVGWERDPIYHADAVCRLSRAREQLSLPLLLRPPEQMNIAMQPSNAGDLAK